jgi:hypothetical protein
MYPWLPSREYQAILYGINCNIAGTNQGLEDKTLSKRQ